MNRLSSTPFILAVMALACALVLALPGRTVTAAFVNDLLIFLDGANRIAWGQVPNRDFHTALGPLAFYIPAVGYAISGTFGGAMPTGMALLIVVFTPVTIHVLASRLRPVLAITLGAFLFLILAAPINLGSPVSGLSFAMFYNRIGWAALALLMVMYLPPPHARARAADAADAVSALLLILIQLYTKATYGVVAIGFVGLLLFDRYHRRWASWTLLLTVAAVGLIELAWRGSVQHVRDLTEAAGVSGHRDIVAVTWFVLYNLADLVIFATLAALSLSRTRSTRDLAFYLLCFGLGLLILNQNAHGWGMVTLYAGAAVAAERAMAMKAQACHQNSETGRNTAFSGMPLLFLFLTLPPIGHHAAALLIHSAVATADGGEPLGLKNFAEVKYTRLWNSADVFSSRYVRSLGAGGRALEESVANPERVLVLDFANPISAGLGLKPPRGDNAWMHWNRNINGEHHLPPEQLFGDVSVVMEPKVGINALPLVELYGDFITRNFDLVRETDQWKIYLRPERREANR